jgi:D-glycero-D-manno-heptose 1,7-bisphosphate phosphatase
VTPARALFCDRDGTLIRDAHYARLPADVELLPAVAEGLSAARRRGFRIVVVSNQSGVGRGLISRDQFEAVHRRFVELLGAAGVDLDGAYYCLHAPDDGCSCRKPEPGLVLQAARELSLDVGRSYLVGDKPSDLASGRAAGCRVVQFGVLEPTSAETVMTSWAEAERFFV